MKEQKMNYEAPMVEVLEVQVEKGFATSAGTSSSNEDLTFGGNIDAERF